MNLTECYGQSIVRSASCRVSSGFGSGRTAGSLLTRPFALVGIRENPVVCDGRSLRLFRFISSGAACGSSLECPTKSLAGLDNPKKHQTWDAQTKNGDDPDEALRWH